MKGSLTTFLLLILVCLADTAFALDAASSLFIAGSSTAIAGTGDALTITAIDTLGSTDTRYSGSKHLVFSGALPSPDPVRNPTVSDENGTDQAFGTPTSISFSKGVATVNGSKNGLMRLFDAGTFTVSVTDGAISSAGAGKLTVSVTPAGLSGFDVIVTSPQVVGSPFSGTNTIAARDSFGNSITNFDASQNSVTVTSSLGGTVNGLGSAGNGVLNRSTDFSNGISDLSSKLVYKGLAGNGTLLAMASSGKSGISNSFVMNPASAAQLAFVQQPANTVGGAIITPPVTVQVEDQSGNNVAQAGVNVTLALSSGTGTLGGTIQRTTDAAGLATFDDLSITQTGQKVLTASSGGLNSATSQGFTITAGAATKLVIQTQPSPAAVAGAPFGQQPVVAIVDAAGNVVTGDNTTTVTASESSNSTPLQGTVSAKAVSGIVTFTNLSLTRAGNFQVQFSSQPVLTGVLSNAITVGPAVAFKLVYIQQPTNASAGAVINPAVTVRLRDAFDNDVAASGVGVSVALNGTGILKGTLTQPTVNGLAVFADLTIDLTGQKTLTATGFGLQPAASQPFTISPGNANQLAFLQQPANTVAGSALNPPVTVRIVDANGNTILVSGTPIALSVATGDTLFGTTTKNTVNGVASFDDIRLKVAGQKTLIAASPGLPATSSNAFTVAAGPAAEVTVESASDGTGALVAGQSVPSGTTITAYAVSRDAFNNFVTNVQADSWLLQNITGGVVAGDLVPSADKRSARFTGKASGTARIVASVSGLSSVASGLLTVTAGGQAAKITVETASDGSGVVLGDRTLTAGGKLTMYAVARDAANNYVGNIAADQWSVQNATGGIAQQDLTPSADKKSAIFSAHLMGQARVQASGGGIAGIPSGLITVIPEAASKMEPVSGYSQETQINTEFPQRLLVKVMDTFGNPVGGVTVTFTAPASGPGGTFSGGNNTAISDAAGVATAAALVANSFSGIFTVTASAHGLASSVSFTLTNKAGPGSNIAVVEGTSQRTNVGTAFSIRFKVTVKDDAGNAIGGALVHFSAPASGPSGNFPGGLVDSARTSAGGEAVSSGFTANFVAGSYAVVASTESGKTVSIALTNAPGPLTRFAIESDKGGGIDTQFVGHQFGIRIRALDAYDNAVPSFSESIVINSTGDLYVGAGMTPAFISGVLPSYTVGFQKTGTYSIVATRLGGGASGTSNSFLVGNPRPLVHGVSPSNGLAGQNLVVRVIGRGFMAGVTSVSFGDGIGTSTVIESDTLMTVTLQIEATASPGSRDVTVFNTPPVGGVAFLANGFTIGDHPRPTVSSIVPSSAAQLEAVRLFVRGANFLGNGFSHLFFTGDGITVDSASIDSSTVIRADITVGATASLGPRDVVIVNDGPGGGTDTLYNAFTVTPGVLAAPTLVQPPNGARSQPSTLQVSWQASPGAANYEIQLATDAAYTKMVVADSTVNTSYQVGPLSAATVYYWHVRARGGAGTSSWSSTWSFDNLPPIAQTISLNTVVDFPDHQNPSDYTPYDYRIVGLPGASNSRINNFIPGTQDMDWRLFWDNGGASGYLVPPDGSSMFTFAPGRAFWMLKRGVWAVSVTIAAAPVDSATRCVLVPIHPGWNLITDPMTWAIPWSDIQSANGTSEPIYRFEGLYSRSDSLDPYVGYYFFNDPVSPLAVLKIPYGPGLGKKAVQGTPPDGPDSWTIHVDLRVGKYDDRSTTLGVSPSASAGKDMLDFHKPRSFGQVPSVYFAHPEWDTLYSAFASDIRPPFGDKSSWRFEVASSGPAGGNLELHFRGLEGVPPGMEVYLVDEAGARYHNLRLEGSAYRFVPSSPVTSLKLLVGKKEALAEELAGVVPRTVALGQNYPNPFNPSTAIPVSLPVRSNVELKIYTILGQEVKTLHSGLLEAGRHVFLWDGKNSLGNAVATGVYISRLITDSGVQLGRKMLLLR